MTIELDAYDLKLLAEIQRDSQTSQSELGIRVNLSPAAVNRRLKRLSDGKVIEKFAGQIAPDAVGYYLTIIVQVEMEDERIDLFDAMRRSFQVCPYVQQCYYVTGEWDFVLIVTVQHMAQYTELTQQLFFKNNNVKRFKTLVAMSRVKVGLEVPIGVGPEPLAVP